MKLLSTLRTTNSRLDKIEMLKGIEYQDWQTFVVAYNPYFMYHQKFKDYDMDNLGEPNAFMFSLLEKLQERKVTGNDARRQVEEHAAVFGDLIKLICNKDLRCGVTATIFNQVHPNSIPQFKVQLAKEVPIDSLKYPLLAQIKYDGVRLIIINDESHITFRTRNGKTVCLPQLQKSLESQPYRNYILDGEITFLEGKMDGRTSISGIINSAMHGGLVCESDLVLHVFDTMPLSNWETGKYNEPYSQRWMYLDHLVHGLEHPQIKIANTIAVNSAHDAELFYETLLEEGYEGMILKHENHLYTFKRSKDWVKVKEIKTADLLCTGWLEGDGKYEGMIGALALEGKVEGKDVKVNVGSGLTNKDRETKTDNSDGMLVPYDDRYVSNIIEIKYNSVIQDSKTGQYSLFLPRFVRIRHDK